MGQGKKALPREEPRTKDYSPIVLGIVVLGLALIRLRLVDIPLERDEGEYALIGKSLLAGLAPYKEAYSMKLPGTYFMYALFMKLFGTGIAGVHLGLILANAATVLLLYLGFRKLFNPMIALVAASIYGVMSLSPAVLGFAAHATHFVTLFVAAGIYALSRYQEQKSAGRAFWVGAMFGFAFLMKQQAVFFILFGLAAVFRPALPEKPRKIRPTLVHLAASGAGALAPYALTVVWLISAGVFDKFWLWTVTYAGAYAAGAPLTDGIMLFGLAFRPLWNEFALFWLLFLAGVLLTFLAGPPRNKMTALVFTLCSFLSICPGFYFRKHYFISFLPAVALMGALGLARLISLSAEKMQVRAPAYSPLIVVGLATVIVLAKGQAHYFEDGANDISIAIYRNNPFVESVEIARYLKENSLQSDRIAVLGSEPQIYLYADRRAVTGYIYTYGLMENQRYNSRMQQEMISEIEAGRPEFLVYCNLPNSWLARPDSPTLIFDWAKAYIQRDYALVGVADFVGDRTHYAWGAAARSYQPRSREQVLVYRRNAGAG